MGKGLSYGKSTIKFSLGSQRRWIGLVAECSPKKGHLPHPRFLGDSVYSFLAVFKEDREAVLNWGAAACGETGVGGSQVASVLSTSRVHVTCPPRGERSSDLTNM